MYERYHVLPPMSLEDSHYLIVGDTLAVKRSGFYNGNRVSWHVYRVGWLSGSVEDIEQQASSLTNKENPTVTSISMPGNSTQYIAYTVIEKIGEMSKREVRKVLTG